MGLFNEAALYEEVAALVTQSGGVNGLIQQFEQQGVGELINGWVGGGTNVPINPDQIVQGIGQDKIAAIASKVGLSEQQVTEGIAKLLPVIVGHLTPNGTAPSTGTGQLETEALGMLKSKLFGA